MKMGRLIQVLVVLTSLAAGAGLGLMLACPLGVGHSDSMRPGGLAEISTDDAEGLLKLCRKYRNEDKFHLLKRANAHAAAAMVRLRRIRSGVRALALSAHAFTAQAGRYPVSGLSVSAMESGAHRSAVVLMFTVGQGQLVHYEYPVPSTCHFLFMYGALVHGGIHTTRESLAQVGGVRDDGLIYVEQADFLEDPGKIRIPDGEVVVALKYPDGSYSNFVPLMRSLGPEEEKQDSALPGVDLQRE